MTRRTITVTMDKDAGRDAGRVYRVTEMPPAQAESWAMRAFLALAQSGAKIPADMMTSGMAGIATIGITGLQGLPWGAAKPLMDELMSCCSAVPDPKRPDFALADIDNHVEEVKTRLLLKAQAFVLHTGFSWADVQSRLAAARAPAPTSSSTLTSPTPSA